MDFEVTYTEAQQRFRQEVRAWFEANVPAGITRVPSSPEDSRERYRELRALGRRLGDKGWLYARAPAQYGGGGLDARQRRQAVDRVLVEARAIDGGLVLRLRQVDLHRKQVARLEAW